MERQRTRDFESDQNGGCHGLCGLPAPARGLRAYDRAHLLSPAGPSMAAAKLRLAELRPLSAISRAQALPDLLGRKARGRAALGHGRPFGPDQAGRVAFGGRPLPIALTPPVPPAF